jgi:hypothetical protein
VFFTAFMVDMIGATVPRKAPILPYPVSRTARKCPSLSSASSAVIS